MVSFEHAVPAYAEEYAHVFDGVKVVSDADTTCLSFDRALLDATQLHHDPEVQALLESQALRRIDSIEGELSYSDRVRHLLLGGIASRGQDMEAVARALEVSVRSLRRRLQVEGASFADLADETRATLAKRLLADHGRAIEHAAYELGFSDPRAFHRAFKRWTGTTPSEFRRSRNP
jgi:AraC-like DNA-binding protein